MDFQIHPTVQRSDQRSDQWNSRADNPSPSSPSIITMRELENRAAAYDALKSEVSAIRHRLSEATAEVSMWRLRALEEGLITKNEYDDLCRC